MGVAFEYVSPDFRPGPHGTARAGKPRKVPMFALAMASGRGGPGMAKRAHDSIGTDRILHCKHLVRYTFSSPGRRSAELPRNGPGFEGKGFGSRGGAEARREGGAEGLCGPRPKVIPDHIASGPEESEGALRTRPALNLSAPPFSSAPPREPTPFFANPICGQSCARGIPVPLYPLRAARIPSLAVPSQMRSPMR